MCQQHVRPSVQKKWRTMTFSRVSTGDSVIPSSCEIKYETAFKPLQGNPAFFWVRASRGPFHLSQKTQRPSHIAVSEGRLLLRCSWKVSLPIQSKTGNHSHPDMIWGARNIPQAALLKLMIIYTWDGGLSESLEVPKGNQATCSVSCGSWGCYGANARDIGLISICFCVHREIVHSWGDISVLLILWQSCWGLTGDQLSKSRLLTCLIGKTLLLCTECRGIGPHLAEKGESHGFSRVAAGTCSIFSSYGGDVHSKLKFVQWIQDTCLGMRDISGMLTKHCRTIRPLLEFKWEFKSLFLFDTVKLGFLTILKNCQASSTFQAVNSTWLSICQRHVTPFFDMKWRPRTFCRILTGDSDILSSCDMNDAHAWSLFREIWTSF